MRRNSSARALGMHNLGRVGGKGLTPFLVLVRYQPKYTSESYESLFPSGHKRGQIVPEGCGEKAKGWTTSGQ